MLETIQIAAWCTRPPDLRKFQAHPRPDHLLSRLLFSHFNRIFRPDPMIICWSSQIESESPDIIAIVLAVFHATEAPFILPPRSWSRRWPSHPHIACMPFLCLVCLTGCLSGDQPCLRLRFLGNQVPFSYVFSVSFHRGHRGHMVRQLTVSYMHVWHSLLYLYCMTVSIISSIGSVQPPEVLSDLLYLATSVC